MNIGSNISGGRFRDDPRFPHHKGRSRKRHTRENVKPQSQRDPRQTVKPRPQRDQRDQRDPNLFTTGYTTQHGTQPMYMGSPARATIVPKEVPPVQDFDNKRHQQIINAALGPPSPMPPLDPYTVRQDPVRPDPVRSESHANLPFGATRESTWTGLGHSGLSMSSYNPEFAAQLEQGTGQEEDTATRFVEPGSMFKKFAHRTGTVLTDVIGKTGSALQNVFASKPKQPETIEPEPIDAPPEKPEEKMTETIEPEPKKTETSLMKRAAQTITGSTIGGILGVGATGAAVAAGLLPFATAGLPGAVLGSVAGAYFSTPGGEETRAKEKTIPKTIEAGKTITKPKEATGPTFLQSAGQLLAKGGRKILQKGQKLAADYKKTQDAKIQAKMEELKKLQLKHNSKKSGDSMEPYSLAQRKKITDRAKELIDDLQKTEFGGDFLTGLSKEFESPSPGVTPRTTPQKRKAEAEKITEKVGQEIEALQDQLVLLRSTKAEIRESLRHHPKYHDEGEREEEVEKRYKHNQTQIEPVQEKLARKLKQQVFMPGEEAYQYLGQVKDSVEEQRAKHMLSTPKTQRKQSAPKTPKTVRRELIDTLKYTHKQVFTPNKWKTKSIKQLQEMEREIAQKRFNTDMREEQLNVLKADHAKRTENLSRHSRDPDDPKQTPRMGTVRTTRMSQKQRRAIE